MTNRYAACARVWHHVVSDRVGALRVVRPTTYFEQVWTKEFSLSRRRRAGGRHIRLVRVMLEWVPAGVPQQGWQRHVQPTRAPNTTPAQHIRCHVQKLHQDGEYGRDVCNLRQCHCARGLACLFLNCVQHLLLRFLTPHVPFPATPTAEAETGTAAALCRADIHRCHHSSWRAGGATRRNYDVRGTDLRLSMHKPSRHHLMSP